MEITFEEAESMLEKRLQDYPETKAFISHSDFRSRLQEILEYHHIDKELFPLIENKAILVLAFYIPVSTLPEKLSSATGLSLELCEELVLVLNATIFAPYQNDLEAYDYFVENESLLSIPEANNELKDRLDLRPEGVPVGAALQKEETAEISRPLTRDELMRALSPKRTMAGDIAAIQTNTQKPPEGMEESFGLESSTEKK